ncbi:hypothetical protein SAMN05216315_101116 [Nitrosospira sp. Nsp18]|nr:hypothetical protein SAMN05216315_101116 [Nitrosospira sp. Nsp18]
MSLKSFLSRNKAVAPVVGMVPAHNLPITSPFPSGTGTAGMLILRVT